MENETSEIEALKIRIAALEARLEQHDAQSEQTESNEDKAENDGRTERDEAYFKTSSEVLRGFLEAGLDAISSATEAVRETIHEKEPDKERMKQSIFNFLDKAVAVQSQALEHFKEQVKAQSTDKAPKDQQQEPPPKDDPTP